MRSAAFPSIREPSTLGRGWPRQRPGDGCFYAVCAVAAFRASTHREAREVRPHHGVVFYRRVAASKLFSFWGVEPRQGQKILAQGVSPGIRARHQSLITYHCFANGERVGVWGVAVVPGLRRGLNSAAPPELVGVAENPRTSKPDDGATFPALTCAFGVADNLCNFKSRHPAEEGEP